MVGPDVYLKAIAGSVAAMASLSLLAVDARRKAHLFLVLGLVLIACNQWIEVARSLTASTVTDAFLFRLATVVATAEPFFIYYFGMIYPVGRPRWAPVVAMGLAGTFLAFNAPHLDPPYLADRTSLVVYIGWAVFTATAYTTVFVRWTRKDLVGQIDPRLMMALAILAFPAWLRVLDFVFLYLGRFHLDPILGRGGPVGAWNLIWLALPLLILVIHYGKKRFDLRTLDEVDAAVLSGVLVAFSLATGHLTTMVWAGRSGFEDLPVPYFIRTVLLSGGAALRLSAFSILVASAVIRWDAMDISFRSRRRAARVMVGLGFMLLGFLLTWGMDTPPRTGFNWATVSLIALVGAMSQGVRTLVDRASSVLFDVPVPGSEPDYLARKYNEVGGAGHDPETHWSILKTRGVVGLSGSIGLDTPGFRPGTPGPIVVGRMFRSRYRVEKCLTRTVMSRVFVARDTLLGRQVVLKEIEVADEKERGSAIAEARAVASLQGTNFVDILDIVDAPDAIVLVLDRVDGQTLRDWSRKPEVTDQERRRCLGRLLGASAELHRKNVVHGDFSPSNIIVRNDDEPVFIDFGLASSPVDRTFAIESGRKGGTPGFVAPEVLKGAHADKRSDVYGLARVIRDIAPTRMPPVVEKTLQDAMAPDPQDRPTDAQELCRRILEDWGSLSLEELEHGPPHTDQAAITQTEPFSG